MVPYSICFIQEDEGGRGHGQSLGHGVDRESAKGTETHRDPDVLKNLDRRPHLAFCKYFITIHKPKI